MKRSRPLCRVSFVEADGYGLCEAVYVPSLRMTYHMTRQIAPDQYTTLEHGKKVRGVVLLCTTA